MGDSDSRILEALLKADEGGYSLSLDSLRKSFPGKDKTIERILRAKARYARDLEIVNLGPVSQKPTDESAAACIQPGDQLGDFRVERLLGAGGMGQVFLARQQSLGHRHVALKVLPGALRSEVNLARFEREAVLLSSLHHPRLAEVYGFGEEKGIPYIAMQFVRGRTLQSVLGDLAAGRIEPSPAELEGMVFHLALDIGAALALVHSKGLIHRDVKPANILLEQPAEQGGALGGRPVLVDFGLVRSLNSSERTAPGESAATPAYASPEQLLGLELSASSDVYSLGVTLHDLLARRLPADRGRSTLDLEDLATFCGSINPDFRAIINKMLERDPLWRYFDASELLADLDALRQGLYVGARHPPVWERIQRWLSRNPIKLLRAVLLIALLLLVSILFTLGARSYSDAKSANVAWEAGDVEGLARIAETIGPLGVWLSSDVQCRDLLSELGEPLETKSSAPEGLVLAALRDRDRPKALREAATALRLEGLDTHPLLSRFLLRSLEEEEPAGAAVHVVARLFFERPVETESDRSSSQVFRRELLRSWNADEQLLYARLVQLTAFSGLGELDDVDWILRWSRTRPTFSEETRLALSVCERILRRATLMGEGAATDFAKLQRVGLSLAKPAFLGLFGEEVNHPQARAVGWAAMEFARALGLLRRQHGLPADLEPMLPDWRGNRALEDNEWVRILRAVDQDPVLIEELEQGRTLSAANPRLVEAWGVLCGLAGLSIDEKRVREVFVERAIEFPENLKSACRKSLDQGLLRGRALTQGIARHFDPDENTRLGAGDRTYEARELETEWTEFTEQERLFRREGAALAGWRFVGEHCHRLGDTDSLVGSLVALDKDGWGAGYLLLSQPGLSEVQTRFRVEDDPGLADWSLEVYFQVGARAYMPYRGEASLNIFLDGKEIDAGRVNFVRDEVAYRLTLPLELLSRGEHLLALRLGERTNTTFRLKALLIWRP